MFVSHRTYLAFSQIRNWKEKEKAYNIQARQPEETQDDRLIPIPEEKISI